MTLKEQLKSLIESGESALNGGRPLVASAVVSAFYLAKFLIDKVDDMQAQIDKLTKMQ